MAAAEPVVSEKAAVQDQTVAAVQELRHKVMQVEQEVLELMEMVVPEVQELLHQ